MLTIRKTRRNKSHNVKSTSFANLQLGIPQTRRPPRVDRGRRSAFCPTCSPAGCSDDVWMGIVAGAQWIVGTS